MAIQGEVKFKVRRSVLMLKRFTIKQLLLTARVPESSARTEINRMIKEGLLATQQTEVEKSSTGGRPPVIYEIVPGAQAEIYASIEPFYGVPWDETSSPTSENYKRARDTLNNLLRSGQLIREEEWADAIAEALRDLEYAEFEEGIGEEGTELARTYIDIEKAKAKALVGDWKAALQLKTRIQRAVESSGVSISEVQAELDRIDECICVREIEPRVIQVNQAMSELNHREASYAAEQVFEILQHLRSSAPSAVMVRLFEGLARSWYSSIQQTREWRRLLDDSLKRQVNAQMERRSHRATVSGSGYGMEEDISPRDFERLETEIGLEQTWTKPTATD